MLKLSRIFKRQIVPENTCIRVNLRTGKVLSKLSLHEKKSNLGLIEAIHQWQWNLPHITDTPQSGILFSNVNNIQYMIPEDQKNITTRFSALVMTERKEAVSHLQRKWNRWTSTVFILIAVPVAKFIDNIGWAFDNLY